MGASAPPTTSVSTIVSITSELAVISERLGTRVGITADSAGLNSCPTAEKAIVIASRCRKSSRSPGTSAASGMPAISTPRTKLVVYMTSLRS